MLVLGRPGVCRQALCAAGRTEPGCGFGHGVDDPSCKWEMKALPYSPPKGRLCLFALAPSLPPSRRCQGAMAVAMLPVSHLPRV